MSDIRDKVGVSLEEGPKETGEYPRQKNLAIEITVAVWVCLTEVNCMAHYKESGNGGVVQPEQYYLTYSPTQCHH